MDQATSRAGAYLENYEAAIAMSVSTADAEFSLVADQFDEWANPGESRSCRNFRQRRCRHFMTVGSFRVKQPCVWSVG